MYFKYSEIGTVQNRVDITEVLKTFLCTLHKHAIRQLYFIDQKQILIEPCPISLVFFELIWMSRRDACAYCLENLVTACCCMNDIFSPCTVTTAPGYEVGKSCTTLSYWDAMVHQLKCASCQKRHIFVL